MAGKDVRGSPSLDSVYRRKALRGFPLQGSARFIVLPVFMATDSKWKLQYRGDASQTPMSKNKSQEYPNFRKWQCLFTITSGETPVLRDSQSIWNQLSPPRFMDTSCSSPLVCSPVWLGPQPTSSMEIHWQKSSLASALRYYSCLDCSHRRQPPNDIVKSSLLFFLFLYLTSRGMEWS